MNVCVSLWLMFALFAGLPSFAEEQEHIEMDVITVYGKESYRLRKEVFELLAPLRKEELTRLKLKKRTVEDVPMPLPSAPGLELGYEMRETYPITPSGDVPTISIVKTGLLLYFLTRKPAVENLKLELTSRDGASQDFYLKRVVKDQYVELILPEGVWRLAFTAEGMESAFADSIVIRPGQISLVLIPIEEMREIPPPAPEVKVEAPLETAVVEAPPLAPEKQISVRVVPLRKAVALPEAQPTIVTKGRIKFKEQGLPYMQVRLYEKEVGFFDPYDPAVENALLAVTATDSYGNFEFPPIDNDDGFLEGTRDPVIVLSLENSQLALLKPVVMTRAIPYRYVIYQRENIQPDEGNLIVGEIAVNLRKEQPVILFQFVQNYTSAFSNPIQILYPSGSNLRLAHRRLEVPANTDLAALREYLNFLGP